MATRYKYSRYLGDDYVERHLRVPRKLYERACKASNEARISLNQKIVELMEREFGEEEKATVVSEK